MLEKITPLLITFNEAANIERTLQRLTWAKQIIVVDSYSTDRTLEILRSYPQVKVFQKEFKSFASQCNYGLKQIQSEWTLSLDADYILSEELIAEIKALRESPEVNGYCARFKYCVFGKPLHGTLYPPRKVLYRTNKAIYQQDGHAHRVCIEGDAKVLSEYIYHDDRKPLARWLKAQSTYMIAESRKLLETPSIDLSLSDRIRRKKVLAPLIIPFYCLFVNQVLLDGWAGLYYTLQRTLAEILLSIHLIEAEKLRPDLVMREWEATPQPTQPTSVFNKVLK